MTEIERLEIALLEMTRERDLAVEQAAGYRVMLNKLRLELKGRKPKGR